MSLASLMKSVADKWPADPFRPNIQLKTFLMSLVVHPKLTPTAVRSARALQEDEFKKKYALSNKMLQPASFPHYYTRLVEAFDQSAKGIGRPWWKIFFNVW